MGDDKQQKKQWATHPVLAGGTASKAGGVSAAPQDSAQDIEPLIADAQSLADSALEVYEQDAAIVNFGVSGGVADPGAAIKKTVDEVRKGAAAATKALKAKDLANARKIAEAINKQALQAVQSAKQYGEDLGRATQKADPQRVNTPWGALAYGPEMAKRVNFWIVPMIQTYMTDKGAVAKYQAQLKLQEAALKPLASYLASPDAAAKEVAHAASEKAVNWAEHTDTAALVARFQKIFRDNLLHQMTNAKNEMVDALKEMDVESMKKEAAELRKKAEEQERYIDLALELMKGGAKLIVGGAEEAAGAAIDIVGGLVKAFHDNKLIERAEELEREAAKLNHERLTEKLTNAYSSLNEINQELSELEPLSKTTDRSTGRKMMRAENQFDKDCDKDPKCKFRFKYFLPARRAVNFTLDAATARYNIWSALDGMRDSAIKGFEVVEEDVARGRVRKDAAGEYYANLNRPTTDAMQQDFNMHAAECQKWQKTAQDLLKNLEILHDRALAALTEARQEPG